MDHGLQESWILINKAFNVDMYLYAAKKVIQSVNMFHSSVEKITSTTMWSLVGTMPISTSSMNAVKAAPVKRLRIKTNKVIFATDLQIGCILLKQSDNIQITIHT